MNKNVYLKFRLIIDGIITKETKKNSSKKEHTHIKLRKRKNNEGRIN